ncbi:MAG TPA: hypothetical protein VMU69_11095, partial [Bradyrhizobium sp.]|nr:hypothetical protein [Bradyrhizobium sp.]
CGAPSAWCGGSEILFIFAGESPKRTSEPQSTPEPQVFSCPFKSEVRQGVCRKLMRISDLGRWQHGGLDSQATTVCAPSSEKGD